ncbi:MAG: hypothetical protein QG614_322, partial [Patescibacteria group bacterium]|nr:hypothetical protein [Patescibacteria group bacterium]
YVFADRERKDKRIKRAILSVVAVIFISLGIIFAFKDYSFVKNNVAFNRIATIKLTNIALHPIDSYRMVANENNNYQALVDYFGEATIVSRFLNIKISIEGVSKDFKTFLLGYGQESYPKVFAENYDARMYAQETWFDRAHNVFMDWLVAGGIIGLIAYLSLYFTSIYMLWFAKGHKNIELSERTLLTGAMIAYFIHNIFVFDNLISYIIFVTLLAYIASRTRDTELHIKSENNENKKHNKLALSSVAGLSAAVSLIAFVFLVWKPLTANLELLGALRVFPTSYENIATTTESSYNKFMLALNKNTFGNREVEEQMIQKALILGQIDYKNMKEEDVDHFKTVVNNFINTSEVNMINGVNQYKTARGLSLLGSYFLQKGDAKSSLEYLSQANNINQTKQPIAFEYVQALIFNNQLSEALVVAQKAYNADTSYEQAGAIVDSLEKEIASSTNKVE